jgi:hypothetical protein
MSFWLFDKVLCEICFGNIHVLWKKIKRNIVQTVKMNFLSPPPPIINVMAYASVASVSVNIWFPSTIGQMPGSIDPIFLWLIGGWLVEEGSFRWSAPPLIQDGRHHGFGFRRLQDKCLGRLIRFFCGSLGVTRGRFLSMISSATHPSWPLRPPSWISFPSIGGQTPGSIDSIFLWLIGGD